MQGKKLHKTFLDMIPVLSGLSHCVSKQVAALIVKDGRIVSTGINGTASGYKNCDDIFNKKFFERKTHHEFSEKYEIHAEMNAILYAAKQGISIDNATIYSNLMPCWNCIKHLSASGIKKIIYAKEYDLLSSDDIADIHKYCADLGIQIFKLQE